MATMRIVILGCALAMIAATATAESHRVSGYVKKDGTYVAPTRRTNPDGKLPNNYSSKPNTNPYSGKAGTVDPYKPKAPKKY
jgi:hypothetical protein